MKEIELSLGRLVWIDDSEFEFLNQWRWRARRYNQNWYAEREEFISGKRRKITMHRAIMGIIDKTVEIDHRDGNGLNNQRSNLRIATHSQNRQNRKRQLNNTTGFIGVYWHKKRKEFRAQIKVDGKKIHHGKFASAIEAAKVRDAIAIKLHGEFAVLNFPQTAKDRHAS